MPNIKLKAVFGAALLTADAIVVRPKERETFHIDTPEYQMPRPVARAAWQWVASGAQVAGIESPAPEAGAWGFDFPDR
jgi:hypothetical protein